MSWTASQLSQWHILEECDSKCESVPLWKEMSAFTFSKTCNYYWSPIYLMGASDRTAGKLR